jgi:F0F1-type ATP synthase membrane subunit b/b'
MKKFLLAAVLALYSCSSFAVTFDEKKDKLMADKDIPEKTKAELKQYFEKHQVIYKECKAKRDDLRNTLSSEAKDAMQKHFKRAKQNGESQTKENSNNKKS